MDEIKYIVATIVGYIALFFVAIYRILDWVIFEVKVWWNKDDS
jgi:hypothetical protein